MKYPKLSGLQQKDPVIAALLSEIECLQARNSDLLKKLELKAEIELRQAKYRLQELSKERRLLALTAKQAEYIVDLKSCITRQQRTIERLQEREKTEECVA